jgi:hypothetical protein
MANFDLEVYIETGAGDTLGEKVGQTTDIYFPIWKMAIGQNIEVLQGQRASDVANTMANALSVFRNSPGQFASLTDQQRSLLPQAEAYLDKIHDLCLQHPNCNVRLYGGSLVY